MKHSISLVLLFSYLFFGCQKIQEKLVVVGDWEVVEGFINGGTVNAMPAFLQHYGETEDCCHYYICFHDDGSVDGLYFTTLPSESFTNLEKNLL